MPCARAGGRLLFAGAPRRHRVSGPDPGLSERLRLFQRLRAAQEQRDGAGAGSGRPSPGTPISIALPGGRRLPGRALQTTPLQLAAQLGGGLAEAALVARVNGTLQDLDRPLESDADLELLDFSAPEGREAFWRSSACVLGAVAEQFYGATLCSAQATEDGFFCDVHMGDRTVQRDELPALEDACAAFARAGHRFERLEATRQQLAELFKHNIFQLQQIEEEVTSPTATVYRCGPLLQLCPGPLLPHTGLVAALRVLSSSAAFWQEPGGGRRSLQRVAAVAFPSARGLAAWQQAQDEAALRDHRRIGREQELFFFHKLSPGSCFFLPRGAHVYNTLVEFIRSEYRARGFCEVVTPNVFSPRLWELSGHWQHYSPHIFSVAAGAETLSLKPMNCPAHCLMFAHRPRSWRELPLRLADFGVLHRNEPPGSLTGLTRVRRFQQDDAHIFCTLEGTSVAGGLLWGAGGGDSGAGRPGTPRCVSRSVVSWAGEAVERRRSAPVCVSLCAGPEESAGIVRLVAKIGVWPHFSSWRGGLCQPRRWGSAVPAAAGSGSQRRPSRRRYGLDGRGERSVESRELETRWEQPRPRQAGRGHLSGGFVPSLGGTAGGSRVLRIAAWDRSWFQEGSGAQIPPVVAHRAPGKELAVAVVLAACT
ncbi:threonine--tRNA ligase, mitochondrial [Strix aluco]|uniref:threonine--tRNA ligase, mitochondrial n=1 Tax=Strix aluco TaxID=111821 RepID=UPI003DA4CC13